MAGMIELNNSLQTTFARAQAFMPKQVLAILGIMKFLLEEYLCWFTRPVEVLLRKNFGVRGHGLYQSSQLFVIGIFAAWNFAKLDFALALFCGASALLSAWHHFEAVRSEMRGVVRYSWSSGEPIFIWAWAVRGLQGLGIDVSRFFTVSWICRFYEPVLVFTIGMLIQLVSQPLGGILVGCSVALFTKAIIVHNRMLNMKRDQIDARLMSQWVASIHKTMAKPQGEAEYFVAQLAQVSVIKREEDNSVETATLPEKQPDLVAAVVPDNLVSFNCRKCKTPFQVQRKYSGKRGKCRKCGTVMVVAAA